jgi:hypothetical protein
VTDGEPSVGSKEPLRFACSTSRLDTSFLADGESPKSQPVHDGLLILGKATAFLIVRRTQCFGLGLLAISGPAFAAPATRNGEHRSPIQGAWCSPLLTQRRTTMSTNTCRLVCRLLGGSGRASLVAVPTVKLPAS